MTKSHYSAFKQHDPRIVHDMVEAFPFAAILVNGPISPLVAQAPLTFRDGSAAAGAVEFHLAQANPILPFLDGEPRATLVLQGPGAAISPSWYTDRFPGDAPDRSRTAPTYNYISLVLHGRLVRMDTPRLHRQVEDLVAAHEPAEGWRFAEIDPDVFAAWCRHIVGYRMEIESFDFTAKLSQEQAPADMPGILAGLRKRGRAADHALAEMIERHGVKAEGLGPAIRACSAKVE